MMILCEGQDRIALEKLAHTFTIDPENMEEMTPKEKEEAYRKIFWAWAAVFNLFS